MSHIFAYLIGLATLPLMALLYQFIDWGFARNEGLSECAIAGCKRVAWEPGEHFNLTVWFRSKWHEWIINRPGSMHRKLVIDFWRSKRDKNFPIHPGVRKWLDRQDRKGRA